jgi:peptide/nickel transport system permease protein
VLWAGSKSRVLDVFLGIITQAAMAVPSFFLGILVTYLFGIIFKFFTPGGYISYKEDFAGFIGYLLFPAISIAIPKIAMTARFLRNSMLTELKSDYVRTAYSKGCSDRRVLYRHVLKNAMMPVITFLGMIIAEIVAGSIVVEQVFGLPGVGRLLISSISTRDFPVVEILILYITFVVIFVYFIVDILYRVIDPRISEK